MVLGEPYIHFTINNEPLEQEIDYNYTWATTIESEKGPVNQPTLVSTASQAQAIFGVDMRPYFAQGAGALIIVRVTGESALKKPSKGIYSFNTKEDINIYRAEQATLEVYDFTSYASSAENADEYASGSVKITGKMDSITNETTNKTTNYTQVEVITNTESSFVGRKFFIQNDAKVSSTKYELFEDNNGKVGDSANIFVTINEHYSHKLYYTALDDGTNKTYVPLIEYRNAQGVLMPESYIDAWQPNGRCVVDNDGNVLSTIYNSSGVKPFLTPVGRTIEAGSPLFTVTSKYEGDYGITISTSKSINISESTNDDGYSIVLTDPALGTIRINNGYDVLKIVNRINDKGFNFEAQATNYGLAITDAMHANTEYIATKTIANYPTLIIPNADSVAIPEGTFITLAKDSNGQTTYLTEEEAKRIATDLKTGSSSANVEAIDYAINLVEAGNQVLVGGSNGEWDTLRKRIPAKGTLQFDAHKKGLDLLRRLRIAGVFCMYGEVDIQRAYVEHGIDSIEPEKGMNNNLTCKWRTIILGADKTDRDSKTSLAARAAALSDQYTLLLGQGLIDTGYYGEAFTMNTSEKHHYGIIDSHQLLPYECTQYVAGLRAKLNYDESIFGGQGRKRIRSIGNLQIAPLFDYEEKYDWDPKTYTYLNESGVLTFTEDYGQITLTDGVTTIQTGFEEDEEGTMNILKYAQNGIYDICLPYIGRNINGDLEQSITMEIQSFLERMKVTDQSIIDTDEFSAYELDVSLGSRNTQLLGRIYIYLKITPVHALRQIEVEMTVQ